MSPSEEKPLQVAPGGGAANTPYPAFDVARDDKWRLDWDEKTRRVLLARLYQVPPYRYFSEAEVARLEALCARLLPQTDRPPEERVPIAPWIDERLYQGEGDGYRYAEMPSDRDAYRQGMAGIEESARLLFGQSFTQLGSEQQDEVIRQIAAGSPPGATWERLPARRLFQELMSEVIGNYYAHPAAWAEIGFNGPASPRGHMRLSLSRRDPWEAAEQRPRSSVEIVREALARQEGARGEASGGATH